MKKVFSEDVRVACLLGVLTAAIGFRLFVPRGPVEALNDKSVRNNRTVVMLLRMGIVNGAMWDKAQRKSDASQGNATNEAGIHKKAELLWGSPAFLTLFVNIFNALAGARALISLAEEFAFSSSESSQQGLLLFCSGYATCLFAGA